MIRLLADVLPYDPDVERYRRVIPDTVDTLRGVVQEFGNGVSSGGSGSHTTSYILGAILAALVALGFLIFLVRSYRRRGEQQVQLNRA